MKVVLSFIGTGKYLDYLPKWYEFVEKNFLPEVEKRILVFTDGDLENTPENVLSFKLKHKEWPYITLERFNTLLDVKEHIEDCDWFIFLDADTLVVNKINPEDIFDENKPYIGVHHPCAFLKMPPHNEYPGAFETNPKSTACISNDDDTSIYYQGCVWGAKVPEVISMIEELSRRVKVDLDNDIVAIWDDESHLNKFYLENKDKVNTLTSSYAYPLDFSEYCSFEPIIVHSKNVSSFY